MFIKIISSNIQVCNSLKKNILLLVYPTATMIKFIYNYFNES